MKFSFATALAALASSAIAAPTGNPLAGLPLVGDLTGLLSNLPVVNDLTQLQSLIPTGTASSAASAVSSTAASPSGSAGAGIVTDAGHGVDGILTVTGPDAKKLLIQLSPDVANLLNSILPGVGTPVGAIVASASSVGDLVKDLGPKVDGLLTVTGDGVGALLISLDGPVVGLVSGLGLPGVGTSVGSVLATLGENVKRDGQIVQDVSPKVGQTLTVTGQDSKQLLIQLSPEVSGLVSGLGLGSIAGPLGSVVKTAGSLGDLISDLAAPVEGLLTVVGNDGSHLLIQLSPEVTSLVSGLGLPGVGKAVGSVVNTVGQNL